MLTGSNTACEPQHRASTMDARHRLRSILGGSAGNLVEWYDWYCYTSLSLYFAQVFFPKGDPIVQLLNTAGIFAAGFLMRPIGAWLMGIYGDRHGRKAGLALSVVLMALGSLIIALTPGHATIGYAAPLLLLVARMIQGLSVGGEYGAGATYLSEMSTPAHRGFWSSFQYVTLIGGQLLSLGVLIVLQQAIGEAALSAWGWRIPFLIGAVLAVLVFVLRRRMGETEAFADQDADRPPSSALALWRHHRTAFIQVAAITAGGSLAFYAFTTYMQKFLVTTSGFDRPTATWIMTAALVVFMIIQPAFGALSDRIGRKPQLMLFGIGLTLAAVPVFTAIGQARTPLAAFLILLIPLTLLALYTAISAIIKAELFPAHIRTLGVALPYAIGNTAFGGTAEWVALATKQAGVEPAFYWYVAAVLMIATLALWSLPDTARTSRMK